MRQALLLTALSLMATGAVVNVAAGSSPRWSRWVTYAMALAASGLVTATGVLCVTAHAVTVDLGNLLDFGQTALRLDPLAGLFLTLVGALGVVISLSMLNWPSPAPAGGRAAGWAYMLLLAAVTVVVVAADAFTFLFAWEALTVAFYVLVLATRADRAQPGAAWATAGVGAWGGASLLVGFLLLAGAAHSFAFAPWARLSAGGLHATAYALIVFGFSTKVGLAPFQGWMPRGYPAAPGPARAAMAGLAVNAGFYGLWRFLALLGRPPGWLAVTVLVAGGVTALLGITFAAVQSDLNRVIAYSSIENGGLIMVGYGMALAGASAGNGALTAVGLLAASLQLLAHAVAKSGLFLGAASFQSASPRSANSRSGAGGAPLKEISGMLHTQGWASAAFAASALTLAGLPPTIGFVSEWFIFEALMQQFRLGSLALRLATASAGALVALTAGVAAFTFVRLLGFVVLGRGGLGQPRKTDIPSRWSLGVTAVLCFGLAAAAPWTVRYIGRGLSPIVARSVVDGALKSPWVLQPVFANFSALSPTWLFVVMPIGFLAVTLATIALSSGRFLSVRRVPAWHSASPGVRGPDSYNAFAYANPIRHVLSNILGTQKEVVAIPNGPAGPGGDAGGRGDGPSGQRESDDLETEAGPHHHTHAVFTATVAEPVESYLYRPLLATYMAVVRTAKKLQSGRLDAYVGYMLFALVAILIVAAALG
ncbi:MAG TPA: proton-conducting transporter membrane subunit [Acidimicrobiales bacterium]|nr:proton-conducting transporter membrane subunit [Acidimicrobiales bacterium]